VISSAYAQGETLCDGRHANDATRTGPLVSAPDGAFGPRAGRVTGCKRAS